MKREHDAAQAETQNLVVSLRKATAPHEQGLLDAELSLLVAKLQEQRKLMERYEAEVQHTQYRMLSVQHEPEPYKYRDYAHSQLPPSYVQSSVVDAHRGDRLSPSERAYYGLHERPRQRPVFAAQPPAHWQNGHSSGQPYVQAEPAESAAPLGSLFEPRHSQDSQYSQQQQPCFGQQPMLVTAAEVGSFPEPRLQQRVAHLGQPQSPHEQRAYDGYDSDGLQQLDLGTHARMPQKGALATKRQKSCVCGLWLYCGCGGYGSGPSGSELDSDDGSGDDDSDSDLDPRSSDGSSKRLKPTHPQPTEVSECLCPASHRREYYSDDFAGGGGYCREGTVGQAVRRA